MLISRVTGKSDSLLASIYIFGLKPALQRALLWSNPTTLKEAFSLARIAETRFEDEWSITDIAKTNDLNARLQVQDLEETIRHKPNKVEAFQTSMVATFEEHEQQENQDNLNEFSEEKDDVKPPIFIDTVGNNSNNDSRTSGSETPAKEVVDNGIESEAVVGLPKEFQEEDMVDALSIVERKCLGNWKELDNESEDRKVERDAKREGEPTILATFGSDRSITIWDPRIKSAFQDDTLRARTFSLARITEARFEDERSITDITKTNDQNAGVQVQDLEETIRHKPNKIEAFQTSMVATFEEHGTKPKKRKSNDDGLKWGVQEASAFEELKQQISTTSVLSLPDFNEVFVGPRMSLAATYQKEVVTEWPEEFQEGQPLEKSMAICDSRVVFLKTAMQRRL
ncbi:hypothetical protein Tco_0971370 [Tanacetum coccineum]